MTNYTFDENQYELALIELFQQKLGYKYICGYDIERDKKEPLLLDKVFDSLVRINKGCSRQAINEAIKKVKSFPSSHTISNNEIFNNYLQNGVEVTTFESGKEKHHIVNLVDFNNVDNNEFLVVNQYTVVDNATKRPDVVVFINGFPLVDIELKSCSREETDVSEAYLQIRNRILDIPNFYNYNAFCIISDMTHTKFGTITSNEDRYMEWKTISGNYEETQLADFQTLYLGVFDKKRLLEILKNFVMFVSGDKGKFKVISGYHQYFAVNKAVDATLRATNTDGKAGIVWHTQGSGKSYSMVFFVKLLIQAINNATIVVLTDRNDLDSQLFETFASCQDFIRQNPVQARDRDDLVDKLEGRLSSGIIFTTLQKFMESDKPLSNRRDIILMADEAHRSHYGLSEKVDKTTGEIKKGFGRIVREGLPNATFIGFTGTPVDDVDRSTREVFGDYIDIYDITQAVQDNATRPIFYESRVMKLDLDDAVLKRIDNEYEIMSDSADEYNIEKSKQDLGTLDEILGSDRTVTTLVADFLAHYEERQHLLTGKAMFVAYSRSIAMKIYNEIIRVDSSYQDKVKVVMTSSNKDPESWKAIIGTDANKKNLAKEFKDDESKMKIAIVVDMWLTGFDVPSLATMYVLKPMKGHNLMQAIARVNRVFKGKEGGLIVDYIGIAGALKSAMKKYTTRDYKNFGENDISTKALPEFMERLSICRDFMHGFDYSKFTTCGALMRAELIQNGINHILKLGEEKKEFLRQSLALHQSEYLCLSLLEYNIRLEAAFFEAVRVSIARIGLGGKLSLKDINDRVSELLKHAIRDGEVINVFDDEEIKFSIFDDLYIASLANMPQKNLAVELLARLLKDEVRAYERTNLVKSELFSDRLQRIMNMYINGQISNAEVLEELRNIASEMKQDRDKGSDLGLSQEEMAFYDALLKPQALKDFYINKNPELITIVKELTEMLNKNRTVDWTKKETARADMRSMVKRLLKKFKYPPEEILNATENVIKQCELFADNVE